MSGEASRHRCNTVDAHYPNGSVAGKSDYTSGMGFMAAAECGGAWALSPFERSAPPLEGRGGVRDGQVIKRSV